MSISITSIISCKANGFDLIKACTVLSVSDDVWCCKKEELPPFIPKSDINVLLFAVEVIMFAEELDST